MADLMHPEWARRFYGMAMVVIVLGVERLVVRIVEGRAAVRVRLVRVRAVIDGVTLRAGRRPFAGEARCRAEQRNQPSQNRAEQGQKDDGLVHGAPSPSSD